MARRNVSLISSGEDAHASFFLGWSPYEYETAKTTRECPHNPGHHCEVVEGGNVFIGTHANLIPTLDTESQGNVYDARVCEPEITRASNPRKGETAICEGGACQHPPAAPPAPRAVDAASAPATCCRWRRLPQGRRRRRCEIRAEKLADALRSLPERRAKRKRASCESFRPEAIRRRRRRRKRKRR